MFYKKIFNYFLRRILKIDFYSCSDIKRLNTYLKMRDTDILNLLRSKYTDSFIGHLLANSEEERWVLKGRLLENLDLLNSAENSEQMLIEYEKYSKRQQQKQELFKTFKDNLINKLPFKKATTK